MKRREPVQHIMTQSVHFVKQSDNLEHVANIIRQEGIHHVPVVNGQEVVGIISSNDLNRLSFGNLFEHQEGLDEALLKMLKIEQVMTPNPVVIDSGTTIKEVAELFSNAPYHALPVVDDQQLVGIVTTKDVIKYLLEAF